MSGVRRCTAHEDLYKISIAAGFLSRSLISRLITPYLFAGLHATELFAKETKFSGKNSVSGLERTFLTSSEIALEATPGEG